MLCPHCLKTVEDGASFCPYCHEFLGTPEMPKRVDLVFCEGCGARLNPHDRTCPKCGRPAPGILSSKKAAKDLAAGRTASFPRLTKQQIETAESGSPSVARVIEDAADPNETTVIEALTDEKIEEASGSSRPRRVHPDEDAYHAHKVQIPKSAIVCAVVLAFVLAGFYFVKADPMRVMPGFYEKFGQAAKNEFPSRMKSNAKPALSDDQKKVETSSHDAKKKKTKNGDSDSKKHVLSDSETYSKLCDLYDRVASTNDPDKIQKVIDDYNGACIAESLDTRRAAAQSAYDLRDECKTIIKELDSMNVASSSSYKDEIVRVRQLAQWQLDRFDVYCKSWDIALAIPEDESPSDHSDEILAPLRQDTGRASAQFNANLQSWKPQEK